ncbi:MAG TPA: BamA/TamA family outer membrane protein [Vicinamibacterales bacterium]|nr:BamA/TamA family outer membrane protein [Vicinamibacterales bacterium]
MRTLALLVALLMLPVLPASAQETEAPEGTRIKGAQISGFDLGHLSPGVQTAIAQLAGTPLDRQVLRDIAARIEAEQPQYVAAIRATLNTDGEAWVVFVVARIRNQVRETNVNDKYLVQDAVIRGVPDRDLDPELVKDVQALTGKPLDSEEAERISARLRQAFPNHDVSWRSERGDRSGSVRLIYDVARIEYARWLRLEPPQSAFVFHSDQGWGAYLPLSISGGSFRFSPIFAFDNGDHLVEEYSGFALQFEARKLGTDRLGFSFEWSTFDQDWKDETVAAMALDPRRPALYGDRDTVTPLVRFNILPQVMVAGGVGITELDPLHEDPITEAPLPEVGPSQMANAYIGLVNFNQPWRTGEARHYLDATVTARLASPSLESDFDYERYFAFAAYGYRRSRQTVVFRGMGGGISGDAPLFERFTLGDSRTLRGWDKYDIAPTGGNRMFYVSAQYQYRALALFLDLGSVWDAGNDAKVRVSTGVSFHPGPVFFTLGVPLNTDDLRAVFTMGFGWPSVSFRR